MTDRETIITMLDKAKIKYDEPEDSDNEILYVERGYTGFYVKFTFDDKRSLFDLEAYE